MQQLPQFDLQLAVERQKAEDTGEVSTLDLNFAEMSLNVTDALFYDGHLVQKKPTLVLPPSEIDVCLSIAKIIFIFVEW